MVKLTAKYNGETGTVELGRSWLELPNTRVDLSGVIGQRLDVKVQSRDLSDLSPVVERGTVPGEAHGAERLGRFQRHGIAVR